MTATEEALEVRATHTVHKMLAEASTDATITFLDACLAIELALQHLESQSVFCLDFSLDMNDKAVVVTVTAATTQRPATFDLTDLRKIIFMVCMPKATPDGTALLMVRRAVFEHLKDPTVQYRIRNEATTARKT